MCRDLKANEIEVRIQSLKSKADICNGAVLLLYKNARVDMDILDETFGKYGWQRHHEFKDGRLYCTVSVYDKEKGIWVSREDVGTESNTEAEKGQASDAFKRACVNFGSGRELYTAPFIYVSSSDFEYYSTGRKDSKGNTIFATNNSFSVSEIEIKNKTIVGIAIRNDKSGKIVFTYGECQNKATGQKPKPQIEMTYEEALNQVVDVTSLAGKTLKEIWNPEKAMIPIIYEQGSAKTKRAIDVIRAEIAKNKAQKQ